MHLDRGLHACHDTLSLKSVLQRQRVEDGPQHTHVVSGGPFHSRSARGNAAEDISTADDHRDFDVESDNGCNFLGKAFEDGGLDAVSLLTGQHLSTDFKEDAPVFGRAHTSPNW